MNEADISIDIHVLKLHDWLISRRLVPKNIQTSLREIRQKISNALQDMPSNEQLIKLLSGSNIHYYHCKEIVEILKQTEKNTKSLFGIYGSQRMRDWQEIVRLYEREHLYLTETAQLLMRYINYEIPGIRKQMNKLDQQSDDCVKRANDLSKPEAQLLTEHASLLQQLGVKGQHLREELLEVLQKLPDLYLNAIKNIGAVQDPIDLYGQFRQQSQCLPILRHLIEFGNTTVYQFMHKEAPLSIIEPVVKLNITSIDTEIPATNSEIDFGQSDDNGGTSSTVSAEMIDFGDLNMESDGVVGDIDWGIEETTNNVVDNSAVEINFDIPVEEYGIVVESVGMDGGVAKGEQAYTILDSPNYRERFLDEIYELQAFLKMRRFELQQLESSSYANMLLSQMDNFLTHDVASIDKWLKSVNSVIEAFDQNEQLRHLIQLKHSPKYADLLCNKLQQLLKAVQKIRHNREELRSRAQQLQTQRSELKPVLTDLIAQSQQLQQHIEEDISKLYNNREVNITGINNN